MRKAIDELVKAEVLEIQRGKGTLVKEKSEGRGIVLDELMGVYNYLDRKGFDIKSRIVKSSLIKPDKLIVEKLGIAHVQKVFCIERLRIINSEPWYFSIIYIPENLAKNILELDLVNRSLHDIFKKEYNHKVIRAERTFYALNAEKRIAKILDIRKGKALHAFDSISYVENDMPIEYSKNYFLSEKIKFVISINLQKSKGIVSGIN